MTVKPITERLRSSHLLECGYSVVELCEEAARTIEKLVHDNIVLRQASEYLSAGQVTHNVEWENDT